MAKSASNAEIINLNEAAIDAAADVLVRAHFDSPVWPWLLPDEAERRRVMPWFMRLCARDAWMAGHGYVTADAVRGVALWQPPVSEPFAARGTAAKPSDWDELSARMGTTAMERMDAMGESERVRARVMAGEPYWYLSLLAVDPDAQRSGIGAALLSDMLARLDADGMAVCLDTEEEANVVYYERHGFRVVARGDFPLDGPSFWIMRRA